MCQPKNCKNICQNILIFHTDLRLRSDPSDPSSQELDAVGDFKFSSSSTQYELHIFLYLTIFSYCVYNLFI